MRRNPVNITDPTGEIPLDFIWDALNIAHDIITQDWQSLTADVAAFIIPYFPAGTIKVCKVAKKAIKNIDEVAKKIAKGHAGGKHNPRTKVEELAELIKEAIERGQKSGTVRDLKNGRTAYYDDLTGRTVIIDPNHIDGGTSFIPPNGRAYFEQLR